MFIDIILVTGVKVIYSKNNILNIILALTVPVIALSACSPRQSVTQSMVDTPNNIPIGGSGQPLYQTSSVSQNIVSQPLTGSALPNVSGNIPPAVDYTATGSINQSTYQKPMPLVNYNNNYRAMPSVKPNVDYTPKSETAYKVGVGDTIYSIGRKFNIHPGEIIARNNILNPDNLTVGQSFMIPTNGNYTALNSEATRYQATTKPALASFPNVANQNQSTPSITQTYIVQQSDTLYSIGRKFNIPPNYILSKNPSINPNQLTPGQVLNIASQTSNFDANTLKSIERAQADKAKTVQIPQSNTVSEISQKMNTNAVTIANNNNNRTNIMGSNNKDDNLEKEILSNALRLPVKGAIKENKNLRGILISADDGEAVKASAAGEVIYVGNLNNYGNMVLVRHNNGLVTNYARLKKTFVQKGQTVNKGDLIAAAGISKDFKTSDVLFEVRKGTKAVNPLDYIG